MAKDKKPTKEIFNWVGYELHSLDRKGYWHWEGDFKTYSSADKARKETHFEKGQVVRIVAVMTAVLSKGTEVSFKLR